MRPALVVLPLLLACAGPRIAPPRVLPNRGSPAGVLGERAPAEAPRCRVAASQSNPLVTEWPAAEKARLESLLARGVVAVAYSGCTMRVLDGCHVQGGYRWQRTTPATEGFDISDEDDLYAKLPLGAVTLGGELKRWGKLTVRTRVAGLLQLDGAAPVVPNDGPCAQATHLIGSMAVGAFELTHGGGITVGASADVTIPAVATVGGGDTSGRDSSVMRSAGDPDACNAPGEGAPHPNCRSPIQVFLLPLAGHAAEEGPPGTVKVDLVSGNASSRWDVYVDDQVLCTTPCTRWLDPTRPIFLRTRDDNSSGQPDRLSLENLATYRDFGPLQLQARPTERAKFATGISFAGVGGMAAFTGGFLALAGSQADRSSLITAGAITAGAGLLFAAGGTWLLLDSFPKAEIYTLDGPAPVRVTAGPGGIAGNF